MCRIRRERDKHVDVAVRREVVAQYRTEQRQFGDLPFFAERLNRVIGYVDIVDLDGLNHRSKPPASSYYTEKHARNSVH
jgi:hypothetical protein